MRTLRVRAGGVSVSTPDALANPRFHPMSGTIRTGRGHAMPWTLLVIAGIFEVGWAIGLKYTEGFSRPLPTVLTVLSMIVTSAPGTVWVEYAEDVGRLTLHVLDLKDEAEWIVWIKRRYEAPLIGIFE